MSYSTNTTEISFPGAHGTIGRAYANGEQEKSNQLGFAIFNYMYEQAQSAGVPLKPMPDEYKPSAETVAALNNYLSLQNQYQQILNNNLEDVYEKFFVFSKYFNYT
jgi:hypothetical protein